MRIKYNKSDLKLLMVSPSIWRATPPLKWFDDYHIVSTTGSELSGHLAQVHNFMDSPYSQGSEANIRSIYKSPGFMTFLEEEGLGGYLHLMDRANTYSDKVPKLSNSYDTAQLFENKSWFRKKFANKVRFPEFRIIDSTGSEVEYAYDNISAELSECLVVQHPVLSGGRGTFFVKSATEYNDALNDVKGLEPATGELVLSRHVTGLERTVQCCITDNELFVGPAQMQLVRHPLLVAPGVGSIQFCGGLIAPGIVTEEVYQKMKGNAFSIGSELKAMGYRGIFGVDFIISDDVYVLEVNPRFTGLTPLLANVQTDIPYMLLHIMELSQQPYKIVEEESEDVGTGSFVILYADSDGCTNFRSGIYDAGLNMISNATIDLIPEDPAHFFIGMRVGDNKTFKKGKSLAFIYSSRRLFDDSGRLLPELEQLIEGIRQAIESSQPDNVD